MTEKFIPIEKPLTEKQISVRLESADFHAITQAAQKFRVSKQAFCRQAILFAIKHMDEPK